MNKNRVKDKIFFGLSMASVNHHIREIIKVRPLEEAKERSAIMEQINKIAWKLTIRSKESNRINWHYARRYKKTKEQLEKLLTDMKIEYVYQQAGGTE
jgi:hypothetical protein